MADGGSTLRTRHAEAAEREQVQPLTADSRRIHITVSKRWLDKLERVKSALSHSHPGGSAEEVIEAAFDVLLEREAQKKGLVKTPRASKPTAPVTARAPVEKHAEPAKGRVRKAIPAHVRREVWLRDQGRCQAKLHDGSICGSMTRVQFDHIHPDALGGEATIENVRLLCASHNQEAARKVFGDDWMDLFAPRGP